MNQLSEQELTTAKSQIAQAIASGAPIGTILPFAGPENQLPAGYKICNGDEVSLRQFPGLFLTIGVNWGGNASPKFNLPDLRGYFLRGVSGDTDRDPDVEKRYDLNQLSVQDPNRVGTYQKDDFGSHTHSVVTVMGNGTWSRGAGADGDGSGASSTSSNGGKETRPINAYVNFIIRTI
ncbi:MAG: phage tail protein [Cyclobacteriaceae bacterium]